MKLLFLIWSLASCSDLSRKILSLGQSCDVYVQNDQVIKEAKPSKFAFITLATLKHEYKVLKKLDHTNIIKPIKFQDKALYLPYYKDGSIWGRQVQEEELPNLAAQLISAVFYLHEQGFVHSDIKPENILLKVDQKESKIEYILADFEMSWSLKEADEKMDIGMTPHCASPEILILSVSRKTVKNLNESIDWFSLGMTLALAASDQKPFIEADTSSDLDLILAKFRSLIIDKNYPKHFKPEFIELLELLLNKDSEKRRFQTRKDLQEILTLDFFKKLDLSEYHILPYVPATLLSPISMLTDKDSEAEMFKQFGNLPSLPQTVAFPEIQLIDRERTDTEGRATAAARRCCGLFCS